MPQAREMQGVPAHREYLKSDGKRRHPSRCIFAEGKGKERICKCPKCVFYCCSCHSAVKCDCYEKRNK